MLRRARGRKIYGRGSWLVGRGLARKIPTGMKPRQEAQRGGAAAKPRDKHFLTADYADIADKGRNTSELSEPSAIPSEATGLSIRGQLRRGESLKSSRRNKNSERCNTGEEVAFRVFCAAVDHTSRYQRMLVFDGRKEAQKAQKNGARALGLRGRVGGQGWRGAWGCGRIRGRVCVPRTR